jgi:serine/threonine protein kinase
MSPLPIPSSLHQGAYILDGVVGRGGLGITYRAKDVQGDREVAIKECFPTGCERYDKQVAAADYWSHTHFEAFQNRLRVQTERMRSVEHPNLARVFDCFDEHGTVYVVMEWVEGLTLLDLIEQDAVSPEEAFIWTEKLAGAIAALHEHGLLHLDIKPENVILRGSEPVLLDFDLVQPIGDTDFTTRPLSDALQCGTPGYAPLEQYAQTGKVSAATDIHALGATFYHLLTGNAPLSAIDRAAGTPLMTLAELRPNLAPHWNDAVLNALHIKAEERPQTVQHWSGLLQEPVTPPEDEEDYSPVMVAPQLMTHGTGFHRVVLTTRTPVFPKRCVCCQDKPDQTWLLSSPSGRYDLPLCEACHRHQAAARASGMVTFWGTIVSLLLAVLVVWASFVTSSLFPLLLGPVCIFVNFVALSYGALKSSRAEEMLKSTCCDLSEPANYNFNGRVHIFRFKNAIFAAEFRKKNADFVV